MPDCSPGSALEQEARALVDRLGGRWSPQGGMCRCPAHDDRTPSLSVRVGHSRDLADYAEAYKDAYGEAESVGELIPAMLWAFLQSDRAFAKARKSRRDEE